jgi:hypothetical protein
MLKPEKFDELVRQFQALLPEDARQTREEIEQNIKALMKATLQRMDLVTREEFDIQSELLARTRAMLDELEKKVRELEQEKNKG